MEPMIKIYLLQFCVNSQCLVRTKTRSKVVFFCISIICLARIADSSEATSRSPGGNKCPCKGYRSNVTWVSVVKNMIPCGHCMGRTGKNVYLNLFVAIKNSDKYSISILS